VRRVFEDGTRCLFLDGQEAVRVARKLEDYVADRTAVLGKVSLERLLGGLRRKAADEEAR